MDTELLPPEEEQKQSEVDPQELQRQFDAPSPRRNAGQDAVSRTQQATSFVKKNRKWFIGGATGLGILVPIFMFFFWLMLFKNVHIKNLYVTYRWAQFNRGVNQALKGQLEAAKAEGVTPEGGADTVIADEAAPKDIIKEANAEDVGPDKLNPADDSQVADEATRARATQQSVEGPTQEVFNDIGVERSVKSDTPDAPDETAAEKAAKNVDSEIEGKGEGAKEAPSSLKDAVKEAIDDEAKGDSPKEAASKAADGVINGSGSFTQLVRNVQGALVIATFYCIFRDVYVSGKEAINKILVGGATGVSQELNKTADCQKLGECSLDQAGAVANKYDNSDESFTESCGYARATQSNTSCKEISSSYTVADLYDKVGGAAGESIKIGDAVLDPPNFRIPGTNISIGAGTACKVILDTKFQILLATGGVAGIILTAPEGEGWAAAGQVVKTGLVTAAATTGGKALIMHTILAYTGGLFKNLSPVDMGNITDMGNLATASGACKAAGCVKATPQEAQALNMEYRKERIAANKKRGTMAKLFDTNSTDSVITRVALNTPTTPSAMMGRIGTLFASLANPLKLNMAFGHTALALSGGTAMAADTLNDNPYNIAEYVPANVLKNYSSKELNSFYNGLSSSAKSSLESQYKKCNKGNTVDALSSGDRSGCDDDQYMKYAAYKFEQGTVLAWAKSHNNQSSIPSASSNQSDDGLRAGEPGKDTAGLPCPAGTTDLGPQPTYKGNRIELCDIGGGIKVNQSAAAAFLALRQAAAADNLDLTGSGFRSYQRQIELRIKNGCPDIYTSRASECTVPTAIPGSSLHEEGLAVDFDNSRSRSTRVYQWLAANASRFGIKNLPSEPWHWSVTGR